MFATYDYKCKKCELVFERFVRKSEKDVQKCYECMEEAKRLPAATPTNFKFNDRKVY